MNRDKYCVDLAKHISEVTESNVDALKVSENLLLIELGRNPKDELIGKYIKETSIKN